MRRYLFAFFFLVSCGPHTREEYRCEGESVARQLHSDLTRIESLSDLKAEAPKIKKRFINLTDLMIRAKKRQRMQTDEFDVDEKNTYLSDQLKAEFIRIYQIEGCQKLMEDLQRESLHRLDLYAD